MIKLSELKDTTRTKKNFQRKGRGPSSGRGKTSSRGHKGQGSRSGYRRRYGHEGGQKRLYLTVPVRGFTRGRFAKEHLAINLALIDKLYNDGEVVNIQTLIEKKCAKRRLPGGIKILANGDLTKKVKIEANSFSKEAMKKLDEKKVEYKVIKK